MIYTLTPDIQIYLRAILVLISLAPSTLCVQLYSRLHNKKGVYFWYIYSGILCIIAVAGAALLQTQSWFTWPKTSVGWVLLATISIPTLSFLFEDYMVTYINRRQIRDKHTSTSIQSVNQSTRYTAPLQGFLNKEIQRSWIPSREKGSFAKLLITFILIGGLEEVVFRGILLQTILRETTGLTRCLLVGVQVMAFAFAHAYFAFYQILPKLFFGLLLTFLTLKTQTLLPTIASHVLFNIWVIYKANQSQTHA